MKNNHSQNQQDPPNNYIPDITIIDLENDGTTDQPVVSSEESIPPKKPKQGFRRFVNIHSIFAVTFVLFIAGMFFSLQNWGVEIDLQSIVPNDESDYSDTLDSILPLMNFEGENPADDGETTILCFGNAPFADDRDSENNLANIIAREANATVYNCAISGSYLAALNECYSAEEFPIDAYNFFWLTVLGIGDPLEYFQSTAEVLGDNTPPEAEEVYEILTNIDLNTVDVIAIMYDASDYLAGHPMYNDSNNKDITCFTGNLEAGIELLNARYPHIRIIVMSPTYAYAIDDGEYISSDIMTYGQDVLSTYVIKQADSSSYQSVSFVDHLYGTITEDNANEYLTDNLHLNVKGRELVAKRFVEDALNRYNN